MRFFLATIAAAKQIFFSIFDNCSKDANNPFFLEFVDQIIKLGQDLKRNSRQID